MSASELPKELFTNKSYRRTILNYISAMVRNRDDAEDITQDTFLKAYRYRDSFHKVPGATPFSWIYRIAHNNAINYIRKKKRTPEEIPEYDVLLVAKDDPNKDMYDKMLGELIKDSLAQLPPDFEMTMGLYFLSERSYQEIADSEGIPIGTVKSRVFRGRRILKKDLSDKISKI